MPAMLRPLRTKSRTPSSVSSNFNCLLIPGWLVNTRFAAAVILSPLSAIASTYINCLSFIATGCRDAGTLTMKGQ
jgi:hypothetical protein